MHSRLARGLALALLLVLAALGAGSSPASADTNVPITGEGSSWAANAIQDWASNVHTQLTVNFAATGSVAGLTDFANSNTDDFAASDIPYGLPQNASPGLPGRSFAYVPDVAGGTALMYNLSIGGQLYQNLKLSQPTIAGIFSGRITSWNAPQIKADNPAVAKQLPSLKITPVVRSDGSGSTALFTQWMSYRGSPWTCGEVSFFTQCNKYSPTVQQAKSGDNGIAGYVSQSIDAGSIGYVEYSYALQAHYPVAKVLNKGGYYVLPTPSNVAVALLQARINQHRGTSSYLTQDLTGVYADRDPRAYPISSYSYFVIPTATQNGFTTAKGRSLGFFTDYALCQGQQDAPTLGYSPLPINLASAGLAEVRQIPGAQVKSIDIKSCNNPTFSPSGKNLLATQALYPDKCDQVGAPATCAYGTASNGSRSGSTSGQGDNNSTHAGDGTGNTGGGGGGTTPTTGGGGGGGGGGSTGAPGVPGSGGAPGSTGMTGGGTGAGGSGNSISLLNPDGQTSCDPDTGQCTKLVASPADIPPSFGSSGARQAMWIVLGAVLVLILAPPLLVISRRRGSR
ncbi:MAG: phosphate ABC transporter substrate-binding protein PstS [Nocardioidaceae bacterium]|nr:phosphate ABC transporter substrate-binding protein PstS [Nocardioidaceae bacterium]MCL2614323.1 phosphate ABC transporter substrate-binding protein PstS [Nocardioidaceae bacterium]